MESILIIHMVMQSKFNGYMFWNVNKPCHKIENNTYRILNKLNTVIK